MGIDPIPDIDVKAMRIQALLDAMDDIDMRIEDIKRMWWSKGDDEEVAQLMMFRRSLEAELMELSILKDG